MCLCHLTWHREIKAANQLALDREIMPDYAAGPNAVTGVLKGHRGDKTERQRDAAVRKTTGHRWP